MENKDSIPGKQEYHRWKTEILELENRDTVTWKIWIASHGKYGYLENRDTAFTPDLVNISV